jgi:hypothetical protein
MRGQILEVRTSGGGTILGADGNRYSFGRPDWRGPGEPPTGGEVDFIAGSGTAAEIFPLPGRPQASASSFSAASSVAAAPAAAVQSRNEGSSVVLGVIGIVCLVLGFVVPVVPTIAAFVLGLAGADSAKRHNNDSGLVLSRIAWIGAVVLTAISVLVIVALAIFAWPLLEIIFAYIFWVANNPQNTMALL